MQEVVGQSESQHVIDNPALYSRPPSRCLCSMKAIKGASRCPHKIQILWTLDVSSGVLLTWSVAQADLLNLGTEHSYGYI